MQYIIKKNFWDLFRYNIYTILRRPINNVINALSLCLLLYFLIASTGAMDNTLLRVLLIINLEITFLLCIYIFRVLSVLLFLALRDNSLSYLQIMMNFDEQGITEQFEGGSGTYSWELILKLKQNKKHFYLYLSPTNALIIPKRVFGSSGEVECFEKFVSGHIGIKKYDLA